MQSMLYMMHPRSFYDDVLAKDHRLNIDLLKTKLITVFGDISLNFKTLRVNEGIIDNNSITEWIPIYDILATNPLFSFVIKCEAKTSLAREDGLWRSAKLSLDCCVKATNIHESIGFVITPSNCILVTSSNSYEFDDIIFDFASKVKSYIIKDQQTVSIGHSYMGYTPHIEDLWAQYNLTDPNTIKAELNGKTSKMLSEYKSHLTELYKTYYKNIESFAKDIRAKMQFPKYHKIRAENKFFATADEYLNAFIGSNLIRIIRDSKSSRNKVIENEISTKLTEFETELKRYCTVVDQYAFTNIDENSFMITIYYNNGISRLNVIAKLDTENPVTPVAISFTTGN